MAERSDSDNTDELLSDLVRVGLLSDRKLSNWRKLKHHLSWPRVWKTPVSSTLHWFGPAHQKHWWRVPVVPNSAHLNKKCSTSIPTDWATQCLQKHLDLSVKFKKPRKFFPSLKPSYFSSWTCLLPISLQSSWNRKDQPGLYEVYNFYNWVYYTLKFFRHLFHHQDLSMDTAGSPTGKFKLLTWIKLVPIW